MATLYTQQTKNVEKTWILMTGFLIIVIALGYVIAHLYGNPNILYGFVIFSVVMNIIGYWYSDSIALSLAGAHPATREQYFDLYTTVENLAIAAGLPMPKIYVIDDPAPVFGRRFQPFEEERAEHGRGEGTGGRNDFIGAADIAPDIPEAEGRRHDSEDYAKRNQEEVIAPRGDPVMQSK